uniref:Uncharacterized protein n=1 Tax=Brassica oleracea TaxID=3712 RepID=A0A3P6ESN2_BRAOL|nr:unnamed protein product [Brassica oleracea]
MRESWARYHRPFRLKEMNKWVSTREPGLPSEPGFSASRGLFRVPSPESEIFSINSSSKSIWGFRLRVENREGGFDFLVKIDIRFPFRVRLSDTKRRKEHIDMLSYEEYDTLPGKRFFTCINYEADGFHYRQPWVIGVQEHIERLTSRVEEVEAVIKWVPEVNNKINTTRKHIFYEGEVKALTVEVDRLTGKRIEEHVNASPLLSLAPFLGVESM